MILVSMADIIGSYERLPNDAVRAVAVAKRREYLGKTVWKTRSKLIFYYFPRSMPKLFKTVQTKNAQDQVSVQRHRKSLGHRTG